MKTRTTLALACALAATLGSLVFAAEPTPPPMGPPGRAADLSERIAARAAKRLDLSETQRAAVQEILREHQPELAPLRERARDERRALRAIVMAETLDEAALEAQAEKIATTTKALTIAMAHLRADLRAILTPEQIDTLMQARRHQAEHRAHHRRGPEGPLGRP